ncbi:hypothetical protein CVS40_1715 [Lucilia cuprina]|nr:hypothetical protein CVS40_1715 [Lucilia cuprina]
MEGLIRRNRAWATPFSPSITFLKTPARTLDSFSSSKNNTSTVEINMIFWEKIHHLKCKGYAIFATDASVMAESTGCATSAHVGIPDNELADYFAKHATSVGYIINPQLSLKNAYAEIYKILWNEWDTEYKAH